jgi:glycosyltransferase involved in cell wall biosynthesis
MSGISRTRMWEELSQASVFAFPCSVVAPCETFSVSVMECCKIGIPVVLAPADSLESIYKDHVLMTKSPVEEGGNIFEFVEAVVKVLKYEETSRYYSMMGKTLATNYTYERAGKVLSDIICENTGFVPTNP